MKHNLSLGKTSLRSQVSASYALMAILPILGLGYLLWAYVDPEVLSQQNIVVVVFIVVAISMMGFIILSQVIHALSDFREHLKSVVEDRILDTPISSDEPTDKPVPESLEGIVYSLIKHNSRLSDMFSDMEELTWSKTRELTRVNLELQRQIKSAKSVEDKLRKSNMQLSDALTKLKELQQCIIRHERLSALGQLASGIAHDINNALMPVVGFAELIMQDDTIAEDRSLLMKMVKDILDGARHAAEVVAKLKDFYRRDSDLNVSDIDCEALIKDACTLTKPRWAEELLAEGRRIEMLVTVKDIPLFKADANLLRDALVNIILNSVDAITTSGTITITAETQGEQIILSVSDTGCGMTRHTKEHCMEPFFTTKGQEATGMGLAIAYGTVRRHSGSMEIDSTQSEGTTVTVRLPIGVDSPDLFPEHDSGTSPQLPPLKILIIDDDEMARSTLEAILKPAKHQITMAHTASEGIAMASKSDYNVVITDRAMPDLSGDEVAAAIRKQKPDLPIIMVTGFGDMMKENHEKPAGIDRIISKPVNSLALKWALFDLTQ